MSDLGMRVQLIGIDVLVPYARNSRKHSTEQIAQIKASMVEWGWTNPILADLSKESVVVAGHGRLIAARELNASGVVIKLPNGSDLKSGFVPVIDCSGWTDAQRRAYVIADNKTSMNSSWDLDMLQIELGDLREEDFDLSLTGFDKMEIADLLDPVLEEPKCDPDEIPPADSVEPCSKVGDVWLCGRHRVMCGDSLNVLSVESLMGGKENANHAWMDPPYLMNFTGAIDGDGKTRSKHDAIKNDKMSTKDGEKFLLDICAMIKLKVDGAFYISFYRLGIERIMRAITDSGLHWRNLIIWKKNHINLSNSDYKAIYEPIMFGWADDYYPVLYGWNNDHSFRGPKGQADVMEVGIPSIWEIARTKKNAIHPTVKPTALVERSILNSSLPDEIWLDLFGGSGTTLIACHMTGRVARLMELEPKYADVIVRRYAMFTGEVPVLESTGDPFPLEKFEALPEQK